MMQQPFWFENGTVTCSECGNTFTLTVDAYEGYYTLCCPKCGNDSAFELLGKDSQS